MPILERSKLSVGRSTIAVGSTLQGEGAIDFGVMKPIREKKADKESKIRMNNNIERVRAPSRPTVKPPQPREKKNLPAPVSKKNISGNTLVSKAKKQQTKDERKASAWQKVKFQSKKSSSSAISAIEQARLKFLQREAKKTMEKERTMRYVKTPPSQNGGGSGKSNSRASSAGSRVGREKSKTRLHERRTEGAPGKSARNKEVGYGQENQNSSFSPNETISDNSILTLAEDGTFQCSIKLFPGVTDAKKNNNVEVIEEEEAEVEVAPSGPDDTEKHGVDARDDFNRGDNNEEKDVYQGEKFVLWTDFNNNSREDDEEGSQGSSLTPGQERGVFEESKCDVSAELMDAGSLVKPALGKDPKLETEEYEHTGERKKLSFEGMDTNKQEENYNYNVEAVDAQNVAADIGDNFASLDEQEDVGTPIGSEHVVLDYTMEDDDSSEMKKPTSINSPPLIKVDSDRIEPAIASNSNEKRYRATFHEEFQEPTRRRLDMSDAPVAQTTTTNRGAGVGKRKVTEEMNSFNMYVPPVPMEDVYHDAPAKQGGGCLCCFS